jgi:hypothetical protein
MQMIKMSRLTPISNHLQQTICVSNPLKSLKRPKQKKTTHFHFIMDTNICYMLMHNLQEGFVAGPLLTEYFFNWTFYPMVLFNF